MKQWAMIVMVVLGLAGCSATARPVGSERVVSSSGDKPGWITTVPDKKGGLIYWVGRRTGGNTEEGALNDAREKCTAQIVNYLGTFSNKLYEYARIEKAANADLGTINPYIRDLVQSFKKKVLTSGMRQKQVFTEKVEKILAGGRVAYSYNAYVLMETNEKQLNQMRLAAAGEQLKKAREKNDQAAVKALEGMSSKLKSLEK